jgi:cation:H+ antiporter
VVGSNIFNVLFILGLSALVAPLAVAARIVRLDVPIMIGASLLLWVMALDGVIRFWEAALLFLGVLGYCALQVQLARGEKDAAVKQEFAGEFAEPAFARHSWMVDVAAVLIGLGLLVAGSHFLVRAAVDIARSFGVSELVIGLTIVAAGTSLPELATSVLASIRGERDIAIGNVIGSNIFNLLAVLGLAGMMRRDGLPVSTQVLELDLPVMVAVMLACLPLFLDLSIGRIKGLFFLAAYAVYTTYLVLVATGSSAMPGFREAMLAYVLPITGIMLLSVAIQASRKHRLG